MRLKNRSPKKNKPKVKQEDASTWPRGVRHAVDSIAAVIVLACSLAYERMTNSASPKLRWAGGESFKDHLIARQSKQIKFLQSRLRRMPEKRRPQYKPEDRIEILKFQFLEGWSTKRIAEEFVLSPSTVRMWFRRWSGQDNPRAYLINRKYRAGGNYGVRRGVAK